MKTTKEVEKKQSQSGFPVSNYGKRPSRVFAPGADRRLEPVIQLYSAIGNQNVQQLLNPRNMNAPQERASATGIPGPVLTKMEQAFKTDFSTVRVHANSTYARTIGALAYTRGNDIHFAPGKYNPETRQGQELLGHELAHRFQNGQERVRPTTQIKGLPVNDNPGLEKQANCLGRRAAHFTPSASEQVGMALHPSPVSSSPVIQLALDTPKLDGSQRKKNIKYSSHTLSISTTGRPHTNCGTVSTIRTAGEEADDNQDSNPGDPDQIDQYKNYGLIQDPGYTQSHAVIRMHMINHNLDPIHGTQGNEKNIFLGTQRSNTNHLNEVEEILKTIVGVGRKKPKVKLPSQKNTDYESTLQKSEILKDNTAKKEYVYWDNSNQVAFSKITNPGNLIDASKGKTGTDIDLTGKAGKAFELDPKTTKTMWINHPAHLWFEYTVTPQYPTNFTGTPPYVQANYKKTEGVCGTNLYNNLVDVFGRFKTTFIKCCQDATKYSTLNTWFKNLKPLAPFSTTDDYIKDGIIGPEITKLKIQKTGDKMMEDVNKKFTNYNDDPVSGYLDDIIKGVSAAVSSPSLATASGSDFSKAVTEAKKEAIDPSTTGGRKRKASGPGDDVIRDMKILNNFKMFWAHNAFPPNFNCKVDYYYASYIKNNEYYHDGTKNVPLNAAM